MAGKLPADVGADVAGRVVLKPGRESVSASTSSTSTSSTSTSSSTSIIVTCVSSCESGWGAHSLLKLTVPAPLSSVWFVAMYAMAPLQAPFPKGIGLPAQTHAGADSGSSSSELGVLDLW